MGTFGQFILAIILIGGSGFLCLGQVARIREAGAFRSATARPRRGQGGLMQAAAHPTSRQARAAGRAEVSKLWAAAKSADWLETQRHQRANGSGATAPVKRSVIAGALKLGKPARSTPVPSASTNGGSSPASGTGTTAKAAPPAAPKPAPQTSTTTPSGRTATVASSGSVEQFVEGVHKIHAEATTGNILAKLAAVKACNEACLRFAQMASMLSRTMSEPGAHYGPEITEPIAKAGAHMQAAALTWGEADTNITTLLNSSVRDLASGSRQAPHHSELSESGAH